MRNHVIITGTGRAGTTFLVELLTELGIDTGRDRLGLDYHENARAGFEYDIRKSDAPYVVKNPELSTGLREVIKDNDLVIDHVLLPVRNLRDASKSRVKVLEDSNISSAKRLFKRLKGKDPVAGGPWGARSLPEQEIVLGQKLSTLIVTLAELDLPFTLMHFPQIVKDGNYLFSKLKNAFPSLDRDKFMVAFAAVAKQEKVSF